jgi:hypothetical protein
VAHPNTLKRITTEYQPLEDRVRLSGEAASGSVIVVWITQRLLGRLVPEMARWLEAQEKPATDAVLVQSFKQQKASAMVGPQSPVPAEQATNDWLATAADVQRRRGLLILAFRGASAEESVTLELSPLALRQWLNMLLIAYARADWPVTVWPLWMREQLAARAPLPQLLH